MNDDATAKPLTQVISTQPKELIEQNLAGQEAAFQTLMRLAMSATTNNDWMDMGGKPYLQSWGSKKIALRFGASIYFDRDKDGNVGFQREDFADEFGPFYNYTVTGKAVIGEREFTAIGTASTRDEFLGMENEKDTKGENVKGEDGKNKKVPVPLHEAIQDAKKKAVTNFHTNAIKSILGIGGFTWEDLEKYGISKAGKGRVDYGAGKPKVPAAPLPTSPKGHPYWASEHNGYNYFYVKIGKHFNVQWCEKAGLKESKTKGTFYGKYSDTAWQEAEKQFADVEMALGEKEPWSEG